MSHPGHDDHEFLPFHDPDQPVRTDPRDDSDSDNSSRTAIENHEEPDHTNPARPRGLRVRFRSIHSQNHPDVPAPSPHADHEPHRPHPSWDDSADLTEVPLSEQMAFLPPQNHERSNHEHDDHDGDTPEMESDRSARSARDRWKAAGQMIRQGTVRLTERLGRNPDAGEALEPAMFPDDMVEDIPLTRMGQPPDEEQPEQRPPAASTEAHRLVRGLGLTHEQVRRRRKPKKPYARSGHSTPDGATTPDGSATPPPSGGGILSALLKLHASQMGSASRDSLTITDSSDDESQLSSGAATPVAPGAITPPTTSGTGTPKKEKKRWYKKPNHHSTASLVSASMNLSRASLPASTDILAATTHPRKKRKGRLEEEIRITVHIAEILARQRYITQLCRALMRYGAPTHRLEEYMQMTAKVLEVDGQFLYLPGCMIMSFDDPSTRTAEVKLVRVVQGVDLGRLAESHNVYKNVVHDVIGVEEAIQELDQIMNRPPRYPKWLLVPMYGLASCAVGPFAFEARPIDMPIIFVLGSLVGLMQHVLAPMSVLYSNVFEVTAAVLTSFLSRAFGSIRVTRDGEEQFLFCFSAMAQSSIALILPGFLVLCSSLELQSHQMIAGSIRMVYAIIYSLFLGYGITVGTTIYGLMDGRATSATSCAHATAPYGNEYVQHFPFVAIFAIFLALINQGKWKQTPTMVLIAVSGYVTNYFSTKRLGSNSEVANTVGAFTIGVLGNLYSRLWHGHAATAILPGIFVLVPSGLASSGSLIAGLEYANQVKENLARNDTTTSTTTTDASLSSLGFGMIQVAIGITVGLFIAALIVYPYGKRRSGLFSF